MRRCKCSFRDYKTKTKIEAEGLFHHWGVDFIEYESGLGNYTVGIIELPGGRIVEACPTDIQFLDEEEEVNATQIAAEERVEELEAENEKLKAEQIDMLLHPEKYFSIYRDIKTVLKRIGNGNGIDGKERDKN